MIYIILILICLLIGYLYNQNKKKINELSINNTILTNEVSKLKEKNYL